MTRLVFLVLVATLSACAPRATLVFAPDLVADLPTRSVFVATTRQPEGGGFGARRAAAPKYLRYDISLPPEREAGAVTFPGRKIDPATQFLVKSQTAYSGAPGFRSDLARALRASNGEAVIYVHGFNNTFDEGVLRLTQLAADFDMHGVAVHFSWPSAGNPLGYAHDRDSLLTARDGLDALISDVRAAGARNVIVVAHSVGSMLVMESLRQRAIARPGSVDDDIGAVVLISPDLDIDLFRSQAARIGTLPEPFGIFVSKRDRVLAVSARLSGRANRLGNLRDPAPIADLKVTLVDVTEFSHGAGHFTAATSPGVISIFARAGAFNAAFRGDSAGRVGLFPGTILTVQSATEVILSPVTVLASAVQ